MAKRKTESFHQILVLSAHLDLNPSQQDVQAHWFSWALHPAPDDTAMFAAWPQSLPLPPGLDLRTGRVEPLASFMTAVGFH